MHFSVGSFLHKRKGLKNLEVAQQLETDS